MTLIRYEWLPLGGLGGDFDPDDFLRKMAGFVGLAAGCDYAVGMRHYPA